MDKSKRIFLDARDFNLPVQKYSAETNSWSEVASIGNGRNGYSVCGFMDKIFIFGGRYLHKDNRKTDTNSCLQFNTNDNTWKEVTGMNEARSGSACAVFEGRIVVSGGKSYVDRHDFNSVEVYDVFGNEWSFMPNMTRSRICHNMVVVRDRLFVIGIGENSCEVYDKTSMQFVAFKSPEFSYEHQVVSIGEKIYVFRENYLTYCYDLKKNEWSTETCEAINNLTGF